MPGKRKRLSKAELDRLTEISDEDIERAKASWREDAPPEAKNLLDAEIQPGSARPPAPRKGT